MIKVTKCPVKSKRKHKGWRICWFPCLGQVGLKSLFLGRNRYNVEKIYTWILHFGWPKQQSLGAVLHFFQANRLDHLDTSNVHLFQANRLDHLDTSNVHQRDYCQGLLVEESQNSTVFTFWGEESGGHFITFIVRISWLKWNRLQTWTLFARISRFDLSNELNSTTFPGSSSAPNERAW